MKPHFYDLTWLVIGLCLIGVMIGHFSHVDWFSAVIYTLMGVWSLVGIVLIVLIMMVSVGAWGRLH
jgi:hypothetical protein